MRGDRVRDALKLNEDNALIKPTFIDARRQAARQEAAARRLKRRASKLGVRCESVLITYRAVHSNPISFSHKFKECLFERQRSWRSDPLQVRSGHTVGEPTR